MNNRLMMNQPPEPPVSTCWTFFTGFFCPFKLCFRIKEILFYPCCFFIIALDANLLFAVNAVGMTLCDTASWAHHGYRTPIQLNEGNA